MKHITKLLLTIIVTFMLVEVLPVNKISADENEALLILNGAETPYSTIELAFEEANKEENKNCVVKLLKDSKIENQLEVEKEAYFTLDLNGHTIDAQKKDRLIYIDGFIFTPEDDDDDDDRNKPGHLIITDSSPNHTGALINGYRASGNQGGSGIHALGELEFLGGTIRDCRNDGYYNGNGAAIYVEGVSAASLPASVLMGGNAKIENCYAEGEGGAVYVEKSGRFRMDGGTITKCHADSAGGAIFLFKNATFEFNGGLIDDCYVKTDSKTGGDLDGCGGGIFAFAGSMIQMRGGEIRYCKANKGGGIFLSQGFKEITDTYYYGSQGFLEGGTISNNRALVNGGGVFVETGAKKLLAPTQIGRLHLQGSITIDNNQGIELKDGPIKDNVYLELKPNSGTDGYRPYFYVDGHLSGRVGINADPEYYGQISFAQSVTGSQLEHLFSDDNGKIIVYRDNINYLEIGHATILDAHLVTWDSDRVSATVNIDRTEHSIRIYAARQKDLDIAFDPETVELIWRGGRLKDEASGGQTFYDSPLKLKVFGPANREEQRCYYQRVTVFDSREVGQSSYSETWDIRIYFQNSLDKLPLRTKNTNVYERKVNEYNPSEVRWEKLQPASTTDKGVSTYYLYRGTRLKLESINNDKEHQVFKNWRGGFAIHKALSFEYPPKKTEPPFFYDTDPIIEFTIDDRTTAYPGFQPIVKQYTVNVVNGYLNRDTSKTSLTTKAGETINAQFKAPAGVDPNTIRFVKWETSGTFKLDDSIARNENITFVMPEESFTLTGIYETKKQYRVTYHTLIDGGTEIGSEYVEVYPDAEVKKLVNSTLTHESLTYNFEKFQPGVDSSDVLVSTNKIDDKYQCSFVMPSHHVDIYVWYKDTRPKFTVTYYRKINGVEQSESSGFPPFSRKYFAGNHVDEPFRSKITASDGTIKDLVDITSDDVIVTTTHPVENTHLCSFTMPEKNVKVYVNYQSSKYELAQVNTTTPGMTLLDSGSTQNVIAAAAPSGMVFDYYELSSNGVVITDRETINKIIKHVSEPTDPTEVSIVMPSYNLTVTAKYKRAEYTLRQINTSDSGDSIHKEGDVVVIKYNDRLRYYFTGYEYHYLNSDGTKGEEITNPETTLKLEKLDIDGKIIRITMPGRSIVVEAKTDYVPVYYNLIQIGTEDEGISQHLEAHEIYIRSKNSLDSKKFDRFVFYDGLREIDYDDLDIEVISDNYIRLRMPAYDLTVVALYEDYPTIKYTLTQIDTVNAGVNYYAGGTNNISIDALDIVGTDYTSKFTHFDFYREDQKLVDAALNTFISKYVSGTPSSGHIKITMPNYNLTVKANYDTDPSADKYPLTQIKTYNEGTANYKQGTEGIHIKALDIDGYTFQGWKFSSYGVEITTATGLEQFKNIYVKFTEGTDNKEFDLTMPSCELTVEAIFTEEPSNTKYTLVEENTVNSGTFEYRQGTKVEIKALSLLGKEFKEWKFYQLDGVTPVDVSSYIIGDLSKDHFTLKMPDFHLKVVATFQDLVDKNYTLVQENTIQEGESTHYAGTKISIRALEIPGYSFDKWKFYDGEKTDPIEIKDISQYVIGDLSDNHFTLIMPRINRLIVEATFKDDPMIVHYLKQVNTVDEGTKYHSEGEKITIRALNFDGVGAPTFKGWKFYDNNVEELPADILTPYISGDISNRYFTLTMPSFDLIVEATYENLPEDLYDLTQIDTRDTGTKSYYAGTKVIISAITNTNFTLTNWKFYDDNGVELTGESLENFLTNNTNPKAITGGVPVSNFLLTMPGNDMTVKAVYNTEPPTTMYSLTQKRTVNEGVESYHAGTKVRIRALNIQGFSFSGWKFYKGGEEITDTETSQDLTNFKTNYVNPSDLTTQNNFELTMPDYDLTVEATYTRSPLSTKYTLTTEKTTYDGAHAYYSGTKVGIEALTLAGLTFKGWKFYWGTDKTNPISETDLPTFIDEYVIGGVKNSEIALIMPSQDVYVEATYNDGPLPSKYNLSQIRTANPVEAEYFEGTKVYIEASELVYGRFVSWKFWTFDSVSPVEHIPVDPSTLTIEGNLKNPYFTLSMPGKNLIIEANYDGGKHKLTTINASPSGENEFYADTEIKVKANEITGKIFDHFKVEKKDIDDQEYVELTGTDLANFIQTNVIGKGFDSGNFTLKMPNYDLRIESIYREPVINYYKLMQVKTIDEGTSDHIEGAHISIQAQKISGSLFKGWKFYKTNGSEISRDDIKEYVIGDISSDRFTLVMPKYDLKVEATFIPIPDITPHSLEQIKTKDEGIKYYYAGTKVNIIANDYGTSPNPTFAGWKFYTNGEEIIDTELTNFIKEYIDPSGTLPGSSFVLTMPNFNLTVEATYNISPTPVPHKLTLVGTYNDGERNLYKNEQFSARRISDSDLPTGVTFTGWKIYKDNVELTDTTTPTKTQFIESQVVGKKMYDSNLIVMPDYDLKIEAVYDKTLYKLEQVYTIDEGSSMHEYEEVVTITAITPDSDSGISNDGFKYYKCVDGNYSEIPESDITFDAKTTSSITIKMPNYNLKVVARFKQTTQKYELTSISTSLNPENVEVMSFMKNEGDTIEAYPRGTGTFVEWLIYKSDSDTYEEFEPTGKNVDPTSHKLTFTMPAKNITIMPIYDSDFEDFYWIDVINGYANGEPFDINYEGTDIIVEASEYDGGHFTNWDVYKYKEVEVPIINSFRLYAAPETKTEIVAEKISNNMTELAKLGINSKDELYREVLYIHQPKFDIELVANYSNKKVNLEVINGTKTYGSPTEEGYDIGSEEIIKANPCPSGMMFSHWRVIEGNPIWYGDNQYRDTATLKLVDDVKVEAIYILKPPYVIPPTGVK